MNASSTTIPSPPFRSGSSDIDILYLGHRYGTSLHRAKALQRLKYRVEIIDPWTFFYRNGLIKKIITKYVYEMGAESLEPYVRYRLLRRIGNRRFKIIWSDQSTLLGHKTLSALKQLTDSMVTYAIDDPFGDRDRNRFRLYRGALNLYDLVVVVRKPNVIEGYANGARRVLKVFRSADEVAHRPLPMTQADKNKWNSDIAFIGTWMPERGPFLARLIELGVPLVLHGDRWQKDEQWPTLKKAWKGPSLDGDDYVKAIQSAKICLGLLSKGNRDQHTTRSVEIPYIGSLLCAERTGEHLMMYDEDSEAVFWSNPEECAKKCFKLLNNNHLLKKIANSGKKRCLKNKYLNGTILKNIIDTL